jgi:hypothetical protein
MKDNTTKLLGLEDVIVKNVYEDSSGCPTSHQRRMSTTVKRRIRHMKIKERYLFVWFVAAFLRMQRAAVHGADKRSTHGL